MSKLVSPSNDDDALAKARQTLEEMKDLLEHHYAVEKEQKNLLLSEKLSSVNQMLDRIEDSDFYADVVSVRGQALHYSSHEYTAAAEETLNKAVKLSPSDASNWTALAACLWRKGDLEGSRRCFDESIAAEPTIEALTELSILLRQQAKQSPDTTSLQSLFSQSEQLAKRAATLNLTHPKPWYVLGNANWDLYFTCSHNVSDVDRSLTAYFKSRSLLLQSMSVHSEASPQVQFENPDLYFNAGNVFSFLQSHWAAGRCFKKAASLDPLLQSQAEDNCRQMRHFASSLRTLRSRVQVELTTSTGSAAGAAPAKSRKAELLTDLVTSPLSEGCCGFGDLFLRWKDGLRRKAGKQAAVASQEGDTNLMSGDELFGGPAAWNYSANHRQPGVVFAAKILLPLHDDNSSKSPSASTARVPVSYLCMDAGGRLGVVSLYDFSLLQINSSPQDSLRAKTPANLLAVHRDLEYIKPGMTISVADPYFHCLNASDLETSCMSVLLARERNTATAVALKQPGPSQDSVAGSECLLDEYPFWIPFVQVFQSQGYRVNGL